MNTFRSLRRRRSSRPPGRTIMRGNTQPKRHCVLLLVVGSLLLLITCVVVRQYGHLLFDNHSLRGGELGRMIDTLGRTIIFRRMMQKRKARLDKLGIRLPPMKDIINKRGIPNLPQAAVAEIMVRSKIRVRQIQEAKDAALNWSNNCSANETMSPIPNVVLQPDHGDFFRPLYNTQGMEIIRFDHYSMRKHIQDQFPALLPKFDKTIDKTEQAFIWSVCALYTFGGYVLGPNHRFIDKGFSTAVRNLTSCDPLGMSMFEKSIQNNVQTVQLVTMAFTPQHAILERAIKMLVDEKRPANDSLLLSLFTGVSTSSDTELDVHTGDQWYEFTCTCSKQELRLNTNCCEKLEERATNILNLASERRVSSFAELPRVFVKIAGSSVSRESEDHASSARLQVSIDERPGTPSPVKVPKNSIRERLSKAKCNAGWICNRCLKNALLGTHDACKIVCPACYQEIICNEADQVPQTQIHVDVSVKETRSLSPGEYRIPRIIHQTWFTEPSVDRYPQLARLQNSWKNLGWEYRFYNDNDVRQYIATHYPPRFLDAFDALIPGAFKADFFRYLVLLKDGGVYSDVDILLDINLDSFITPSMSFFVPRDIVGDYAGENFCLWNGMMGAVPGHPFMARAAEMLLTNILNRVDYYDMEREMCQSMGTSGEVWKVRALTILSLSGPCLLGSAVNKALGRNTSLFKYDPGWLIPDDSGEVDDRSKDVGDALLLIASRADMGGLRFSDVDRNLLVASTGMTELFKDPIQTQEEVAQLQDEEASHAHYSSFEHVDDVFGAAGIYIDNLVTNENVRLTIKRQNEEQ